MNVSLLLLLVMAAGSTVYAENVPVSLIFEIENIASGDTPPSMEYFMYEITSEESPLPEEAVYELAGTGSVTLEEIVFTAPGIYTYTISQLEGSTENYVYDTTIYDIEVYITSDDAGVLSLAYLGVWNRESGKKAESIYFENIYQAPDSSVSSGGGTPTTGDESELAEAMVVMGLSVFGIMAVLIRRKRAIEK